MKIVVILLFFIHGGIHLIGFIKAFHLAEIKELSRPVSKSNGIMWLLTAATLVAAGVFLLLDQGSWWKIGLTGLLLSQIMILNTWQDARYGTLINLLLALGTWLLV